jgi:hypothetical protein
LKKNGIDEMYTGAVRVFSSVIILFGLVIVVATLAKGGGPLSVGFVLGLGFLGLGCGRLYLTRQ